MKNKIKKQNMSRGPERGLQGGNLPLGASPALASPNDSSRSWRTTSPGRRCAPPRTRAGSLLALHLLQNRPIGIPGFGLHPTRTTRERGQ